MQILRRLACIGSLLSFQSAFGLSRAASPTRLAAMAGCALLLAASSVSALMPPHTTRAEPGEGGDLTGRAIVFHGYSLDYADKVATVVEVETKAAVANAVDVQCEWVGKGDCEGCRQQKCHATVTLVAVVRDRHYKVEFLDTSVTVRATTSDPAVAPKAGAAPKAKTKTKSKMKAKTKTKTK